MTTVRAILERGTLTHIRAAVSSRFGPDGHGEPARIRPVEKIRTIAASERARFLAFGRVHRQCASLASAQRTALVTGLP